MNWSRGFFRAWVAFTVLWHSGCAFYMWSEWPPPEMPVVEASDGFVRDKDGNINFAETLLKSNVPKKTLKYDPDDVRAHVFNASMTAIIPPPVLFVFGWGFLWIGRGFRS